MAEIIADPGFGSFGRAGSRWEAESHVTVVHRASVDGEVLRIDQSGATGIGWHGELRYAPFPVRRGDRFDVSFSARFTGTARLGVWIGQYRKPWRSLLPAAGRFDGRELGSEWGDFAFRAEIVADEPAARLNFVFGERDGTFFLRRPSVRAIAAAAA